MQSQSRTGRQLNNNKKEKVGRGEGKKDGERKEREGGEELMFCVFITWGQKVR